MPWYRYRARDAEGTAFTSTIEAASAYEATVEVRNSGAELDGLERVPGPEVRTAPSELPPPVADRYEPEITGQRLEPVADRPPAAPRSVSGVTGVAGGLVFIAIGSVFTVIAAIFVIIGLAMLSFGAEGALFFTLFPLIHLTIGLGMLGYAVSGRRERRRIVADGEIALGRVLTRDLDPSTRINGRRPFRMTYEFDVEGTTYTGKHSSMNEAMQGHRPHDRIWVLYDPIAPHKNVEWPPL